MEIIQQPISDKHKSSMFFNGIVATGIRNDKIYWLRTDGCGEIEMEGIFYQEEEIRELGEKQYINDYNIDNEFGLSIHVDNWFIVVDSDDNWMCVDDCDNFDDAIEIFKNFLNQ